MKIFNHNLSLRQKISLGIILVTAFALFPSVSFFIFYDLNHAKDEMIYHTQFEAKLLANNIASSVLFSDIENSETELSSLKVDPNTLYSLILDQKGNIFSIYPKEKQVNLEKINTLEDGKVFIENKVLYIRESVYSDQEKIASIVIAVSLKKLDQRFRDVLFLALSVGILILLLSVLLSFTLSRSLFRPLFHLSQVAKKISEQKDYSIRAKFFQDDEIGNLVNTFNQMLVQIQARDIQLSGEIVESQMYQKLILDVAPNAILSADLQTLKILTANTMLSEIFSYSIQELMKMKVTDLIPELNIDLIRMNGRITHIESEGVSSTEKKIPIEYAVNCGILEKKKFLIVIIRDLTVIKAIEEEKREIQEQLVQSQKLDSIGKLAGGIAHDFNNLLMGILGYADLLLKQVKDDPKKEKMTKYIHDASMRASNLTQQLLSFARKGPFEAKPIHLNAVVDESISLLGRSLGLDVKIHLDLCDQLKLINGDATQMQQVVTNLLVNARDAMNAKGDIFISTQNLSKSDIGKDCDIDAENIVLLTVRDTGTGIPQKIQKEIFDPFFTTKELGKGTGLGLSMVYGIVNKHKGWIQLDSEEGKGASFSFYFPALEKRRNLKEEVEIFDVERLPKALNLLIVDDEVLVRDFLSAALGELNYEVQIFESGTKALQLEKQKVQSFDLAILDLMMPEKDGLETYMELLKIRPNFPVIFMSGFNENEQISKLCQNDDVAYLRKPFSSSDLYVKIVHVLGG